MSIMTFVRVSPPDSAHCALSLYPRSCLERPDAHAMPRRSRVWCRRACWRPLSLRLSRHTQAVALRDTRPPRILYERRVIECRKFCAASLPAYTARPPAGKPVDPPGWSDSAVSRATAACSITSVQRIPVAQSNSTTRRNLHLSFAELCCRRGKWYAHSYW